MTGMDAGDRQRARATHARDQGAAAVDAMMEQVGEDPMEPSELVGVVLRAIRPHFTPPVAGGGMAAVTVAAEAVRALVEAGAVNAEPTVEHALLMSGGGMHVRSSDAHIERVFPLADWIRGQQRFGGKVYRRTVIIVDDWCEVPREEDQP